MGQIRIGIQIEPNDSFWIQVEEAIHQLADHLERIDLVPIEISDPLTTTLLDEHGGLVEEVLAQDVKALICKDFLPLQLPALLDHNLPVIYLAETDFQHPLFCSPRGLYDTARLVANYLVERLQGRGHILLAGGLVERNADDGSTRLAGFCDVLRNYSEITWDHIPTAWNFQRAKAQIAEAIRQITRPIDAVFGLSDTIALAVREVGIEQGIFGNEVYIAGINGDPLALAAIAKGDMALTIETPAAEFGRKAIELAYLAAQGDSLPAHFSYEPYLITVDNVNKVALQKLMAIADLPSRMVGVNRRQEQHRLVQLETSADISRRVGTLLDRQMLLREISELIRAKYGYDEVQVFFRSEAEQQFTLVLPDATGDLELERCSLEGDPVFAEVVRTNAPVFIPNVHSSQRFPPGPEYPNTHSRVTLPIQLGEQLIGLLDLHSHQPTMHLRYELIGLQSLANQIGIVMKNAELYTDALEARARAERADQLKTRLLANVSHELRTPLNVIIGYAQTALATPNPYALDLPPLFQRDMGYIAKSGQHLLHLINDLLSLSQAEIGELELYKEIIAPRSFLEESFNTLAAMADTNAVNWRLVLPEHLPMIEADPVRLRQILLNLLHNASKFTTTGEIESGAEVVPPYIHFWVRDTGPGIPTEMQEQIFEPFVKLEQNRQHQMGVGLGLTIVRRLVALHGGLITLESRIEQGSTFHIYLPLPDAAGRTLMVPETTDPVLLLISLAQTPSPAITALCERQKLTLHRLTLDDDLDLALEHLAPAGLAWDLTYATPEEWTLFERIRSHPRLFQLPLMIYGRQNSDPGLTDVLMKPISDKTLIGALTALYSHSNQQPILIVDDDPDARSLYQKVAAQALPGRTIQCAEDGAAALAMIEQEPPGLVILDLMMPEIDGFTVLKKMRSQPRTRHVPVIVLSGHLLSAEDVRRLDYSNVVFHTKDLLSQEETAVVFQQSVGEPRALSQSTSLLVKQAIMYLHQHYANAGLSRQEVAASISTSKQHLDRIFSKEVGLSVNDYLTRFRIERAKEWLVQTSEDITSIALRVGFNDSAYFSRVFRKLVGQAPSEYRRQG